MPRKPSPSNEFAALLSALPLLAALAGCTPSQAAEQPGKPAVAAPAEPTLDQVRAATARFKDVNVALKEGYLRDPMDLCEEAAMMGRPPAEGVMGVHYFRPDLLGITGPPNPRVDGTGTHTDFNTPSILIYEPQKDGSMALVAVENLTFIKAWEAAGNKAPPTFQGVSYNRMVDDPATATVDEAHHFEPHYDLHVWLYKENPAGMFAQFNPAGTCKHHKAAAHAH